MKTVKQTHANTMLDAKTSGYVKAYAYTAIFNAILVLFKESFPIVHDVMASLGHHWITHGVLDLLVFFGLGMLFAARNETMEGSKAVTYLIWSTIVGGGIIALFNLINVLG
ncbi:MAG: hypothetical protein QM492_07430 [Rhodobacterales bacterium]